MATLQRIHRAFLPVGLLLLAHQLSADSIPINWIGPPTGNPFPDSGNWNTPGNWDLGVVPNNSGENTYAVTIGGFGNFSPTITVDTSPTVDSLRVVNGNVTLSPGQTLTTGQLSVEAMMQNGDFSANGVLNVTGSAAFSGVSSLSVGGTANFGALSIASPPDCACPRLSTSGLVNIGSTSGLGLASIGGTVNVANAPGFLAGPISISGTLSLGTTNRGPLSSSNTLINSGSISLFTAPAASVVVGGDVSGGGAPFVSGLEIADGTLGEVIDSPTQFGAFTLEDANILLGGNLDVVLANSFIPPVGSTFPILQTSGEVFDLSSDTFAPALVMDTFHSVEGLTFNDGTERWDIVYKPNEVDLVAKAVATPEPSMFVLAGLGLFAICASRVLRRIRVR